MAARSSLLRRAYRHASSVVAALAALAPRLVRLAHHDYPDGLLARAAARVMATRDERGRSFDLRVQSGYPLDRGGLSARGRHRAPWVAGSPGASRAARLDPGGRVS